MQNFLMLNLVIRIVTGRLYQSWLYINYQLDALIIIYS